MVEGDIFHLTDLMAPWTDSSFLVSGDNWIIEKPGSEGMERGEGRMVFQNIVQKVSEVNSLAYIMIS